MTRIVVASFLEQMHLDRIRAVDPSVSVLFDSSLVSPPRYAADHVGAPFERSADQERQWVEWLQSADILFDFDRSHETDLPDIAPQIRWIQGTSAGIGQYVEQNRYHERMPHTVFTTASGVHAVPLAEYCMMSMLMFSRGFFRVWKGQSRRNWERYAGTDLQDRTLVVVGLGKIGREVARLAKACGMFVIGIKRSVTGMDASEMSVDELCSDRELHDVLPRAEFVVLVAPHTAQTEGMIGETELHLMPAGAVLINIGRGHLVDEDALVDALRSGHLGGASLDVFRTEPLPPDSPLWSFPNVLISPHSGSTSDRENGRITDLFCSNLRRFLDGQTLENVFDPHRLY